MSEQLEKRDWAVFTLISYNSVKNDSLENTIVINIYNFRPVVKDIG